MAELEKSPEVTEGEFTQARHQTDGTWPVPLGAGILVEARVQKHDSSILLLGNEKFMVNAGHVRAISPKLDDELADIFLPEGNGSVGTEVIFAESSVTYLGDHGEDIYEELGFVEPTEDNEYGQLIMLDVRRVLATIPEDLPEDAKVPFAPWGQKVFLEFEYDDQGVGFVGTESGEVYGPDDETSEIVIPESSQAVQENQAQVTALGQGVEKDTVQVGDWVIPPLANHIDALEYEDETYFFVHSPDELMARISR